MPNKVYMPDEDRHGGGTTFFVTWENIEEYLRGKALRQHSNPALDPHETCEFVVEERGISVIVENVDNR
jgi:hypothetical protein